MIPSNISQNPGIVASFGISYVMICCLVIGIFHMIGIILVALSLVTGFLLGMRTYIAYKVTNSITPDN